MMNLIFRKVVAVAGLMPFCMAASAGNMELERFMPYSMAWNGKREMASCWCSLSSRMW